MSAFTRYLTATGRSAKKFSVNIEGSSLIEIAQATIHSALDLRYSPILPAYLMPGFNPPEIPKSIQSIAFLFARSPYKVLGRMKSLLTPHELIATYFTEGLASILILDVSIERGRELQELFGKCPLEHWTIQNGILELANVHTEFGVISREINDR